MMDQQGMPGPRPGMGPNAQQPGRPGMPAPAHRRFEPDMPDAIRAKAAEAAKLEIDLEEVLSRQTLDRAKATELHGQIAKLKQEIEDWRFSKRLDRIEERGRPEGGPEPGEPDGPDSK